MFLDTLVEGLFRTGDMRQMARYARAEARRRGEHEFADRLRIIEGQIADAYANR